ncbi:MAG TPA: helix-turn-helix domain-containing protein, partial [Polyangiales bacterium]
MRSERPSLGPSRRTEGVRIQGRSARVVEAVLQATAEELGRVGFLALRIDDVAERSGVNKTTIYRRWATKEELVAAMLERMTLSHEVPDTGSLRGDLNALLS